MRGETRGGTNARAKLQQPDDLKKVYDAAFDKIIVQPVQGVEKVYAVLSDGIKATLQLIDYVESHRTIANGKRLAGAGKGWQDTRRGQQSLKAHNAAGYEAQRRQE